MADQLGIDPQAVEVLHSDTAVSALGLDTYGSRSLAVGGTAVHMATEQVLDKARDIAAHQLEASADDLEFEEGSFHVRGSPGQVGGHRGRGHGRASPPTTCPTAWSPT